MLHRVKINRIIVVTVTDKLSSEGDTVTYYYQTTRDTQEYRPYIREDIGDRIFKHYMLQSGVGIRVKDSKQGYMTIEVNGRDRFEVTFTEDRARVIP